jgi:hypothetical protein
MKTFNQMLDEYYEERSWDIEKGIPTKEKLTELGMADIAADLEKQGSLKKASCFPDDRVICLKGLRDKGRSGDLWRGWHRAFSHTHAGGDNAAGIRGAP